MFRAATALLLLATVLGGCLGGEARTEWAYTITQLDLMPDAGRTGKGVTIAVIDTGANRDHPALSHLFDGQRDNGEVVAFQDYMHGKQGVDQTYDDAGHGSHVLGIIGAAGSTLGDKLVYGGVDLKGGAPDATFVIAKVCDLNGCASDQIPAAIRWATSQGAQVISLSLGGPEGSNPFGLVAPDDLTSAVNEAIDKGVVVIASAGNDGPSNSDVYAPSNIQGVISVGAIDSSGQVWDKSNRGDDAGNPCQTLPVLGTSGRCDPDKKPELVAPGVEILSAWTGGSYVRATGTSQACPFVTSAVGLILQGRPHLTGRADVEHMKTVLEQTARKIGGQKTPHDDAAGYGIVQAKAAYDAYRPA